MLLLLRLYPKGGPKQLCDAIDSGKRNLFVPDVQPLYAIRLEERREVGIVLDVKRLDSVMKVFLTSVNAMAEVKEVMTESLMDPVYFPPPKEHATGQQRYLVRLRASPVRYKAVYNAIRDMKGTPDTWISYLSYSFGDFDITVNLLAKNREAARKFTRTKLGKIRGVEHTEVTKIVQVIPLLSTPRMITQRNRFMWSAPAGSRGKREDPAAFRRYAGEKSPLCVIVRLSATKRVLTQWDEIEKSLRRRETRDVAPIFASLQEAKGFISVMFEARNLEVLKDFLVDVLPKVMEAEKTRTIPLLEPTYFLMPREHRRDLKRFLVSLRTEPTQYHVVRSRVFGLDYPDDIHPTYLSYIMGQNDLVLSVLARSARAARDFARQSFGSMPEVLAYDVSSQLRTTRLTSRTRWRQHRNKYLSSYDKQHRKDYDAEYDWTESSYAYDLMNGAQSREMED